MKAIVYGKTVREYNRTEELSLTTHFAKVAKTAYQEDAFVEHEFAVRPTRLVGPLPYLKTFGLYPYSKANDGIVAALSAGHHPKSDVPLFETPPEVAVYEIVVTLPEKLQEKYLKSEVDARLELIQELEQQGSQELKSFLLETKAGPTENHYIAATDLHDGLSKAEIPGLHLHLRLFNLP